MAFPTSRSLRSKLGGLPRRLPPRSSTWPTTLCWRCSPTAISSEKSQLCGDVEHGCELPRHQGAEAEVLQSKFFCDLQWLENDVFKGRPAYFERHLVLGVFHHFAEGSPPRILH